MRPGLILNVELFMDHVPNPQIPKKKISKKFRKFRRFEAIRPRANVESKSRRIHLK